MITWIKHLFSPLNKITRVEIEYSLITKSGNTIYAINKEIIPKELIAFKCSDYDWVKKEKEVIKRYKKVFDNKARQLLNKFQINEKKKIKRGWINSGDYIVKCVWDISVELGYLNLKEYKFIKTLNLCLMK